MTTNSPATPLQVIIDITFQVAVNGHLDTAAEVSREQIGVIYEAARLAMAERAQLVEALKNCRAAFYDYGVPWHASRECRDLLRSLGESA